MAIVLDGNHLQGSLSRFSRKTYSSQPDVMNPTSSKNGSNRTYPEDQMMTKSLPHASSTGQTLCQPPRGVSNILDFTDNTLLEEWPKREPFMDLDDEMSLSSSKLYKEVSFSTYSSLHVYQAYECEDNKSCEIKVFKQQASLDAIRIQELKLRLLGMAKPFVSQWIKSCCLV